MDDTCVKKLADVDIMSVKKESLADIKKVEIDPSLNQADRILSFIEQVKNPYCFVCDGVIVKINYAETEETLEDKLNSFFLSI